LKNDKIPKVGSLFRNSAYANLIDYLGNYEKKITGSRNNKFNKLHDAFYKGDVANSILKYSQKNEWLLSKEDIENFNVKFEKTTASKDKQGNPNVFNLSIFVRVNVTSESGIEQSKVFSEAINYNNNENKFNLKKYEDSLKENLTEKIIEDLLLYLQSISVNKSNASLKGNIGYTVKK